MAGCFNGQQTAIMKRVYILLSLVCLFSLGWADSWQTIRDSSGRISSVQAEFRQEKHLKMLSRPIISKGIFVFQAPSSLRWQYLSPVQSLLLMDRGKTRTFSQQDGKLVEQGSMGMEAMQVISQEISLWLTGRFTDNPTFAAELRPNKMIVLTPKEEGLACFISRIELVLADQPGLMESVTIYEGKDSFTRILFSNIRLNETIPATVFTEQ
jgi:outer membrane lipoprotein-sorting protein